MARGGYRRHHVPPALNPEEVRALRVLRCVGKWSYKAMMRWTGLSRETLSRAINGDRTYRGIDDLHPNRKAS